MATIEVTIVDSGERGVLNMYRLCVLSARRRSTLNTCQWCVANRCRRCVPRRYPRMVLIRCYRAVLNGYELNRHRLRALRSHQWVVQHVRRTLLGYSIESLFLLARLRTSPSGLARLLRKIVLAFVSSYPVASLISTYMFSFSTDRETRVKPLAGLKRKCEGMGIQHFWRRAVSQVGHWSI